VKGLVDHYQINLSPLKPHYALIIAHPPLDECPNAGMSVCQTEEASLQGILPQDDPDFFGIFEDIVVV
jgi:hypothetical protein